MRDWYQLANEEADPTTRQYTEEGMERLAEADVAWQGYLQAVKKPEPSLASLMIQVYGPTALNKPAEAAEAAEIVATADQKRPGLPPARAVRGAGGPGPEGRPGGEEGDRARSEGPT